tara:strand:- start:79 stop:324 length:246 start_codon:yes stop_codon:yes gene_type:complete
MGTRETLVEQVREFLSLASSPSTRDRVSATYFGMNVAKSPNFVRRLYAGHDVTTVTYDRAIEFMEKWYQQNGYYPDDDNYA